MSAKYLLNILMSLSVVCSFNTYATAPTPLGLEYCTVCHGSQLKGNVNIGAPRLSGLPQWYIERQLLNFKDGIRGVHTSDDRGMEMRPMVSEFTPSQIKNIAEWVATTQSPKPEPTLIADSLAGKTLFTSCAACHGAQGEGNKPIGAPALAGLNDWYIVTQLNHFRNQIRGNKDNDTYGQQMIAASAIITSEQDAANLAAYITSLPISNN